MDMFVCTTVLFSICELRPWIQLQGGSCWNITFTVGTLLGKKERVILGFAFCCIDTMRFPLLTVLSSPC